MEYYNWKNNDNPFNIHKYLSPLCLFVLSPNPFNFNSIPIKTMEEVFSDEYIMNIMRMVFVVKLMVSVFIDITPIFFQVCMYEEATGEQTSNTQLRQVN